MSEAVVEFFKGFSIQTTLSMIGVMWYFKGRIDEKIDKMIQRMDAQMARTDRLYEMYLDQRKEMDQKFYDMLKEQTNKK